MNLVIHEILLYSTSITIFSILANPSLQDKTNIEMHTKLPFLSFLFAVTIFLNPSQATNYDIQVGPALSFSPNTTSASPGDTLTFHFHPGKHNVAQSLFSTPCVASPGSSLSIPFPSQLLHHKPSPTKSLTFSLHTLTHIWYTGGFYSTFIIPPSDTGTSPTTFIVTVNNTDPIWFYCSEYMHCQLGMAGVVNPPYVSLL